MKRTILILTSKTGGGHVSIAEALRDRLADTYTIELLDPQSSLFHWHYRLVSRYALWLWAAEFKWTDTSRRALVAHRLFARGVAHALVAAFQRVQPDVIISTYPFLTYEVVETVRHMGVMTPFVMLFTDPNGVHASWLTEKRAAATLAPTRETYDQALSAGFASERLHQVGWPVRLQFSNPEHFQRTDLLHKLGLDPARFTLFLQGGGEGAAQFVQTIERILGIDPRPQVILATGTNRALLQRFQHTPDVYALPFTREIAPFMAAADVIMGKAGPNMLFEAVTLGKPFIATAYIPGQEEANLEFIRRYGLGWVALRSNEQVTLLTQLLGDPALLQSMIMSVEAYRDWNNLQTAKIVPIIEAVLPQQVVR